MRTTAIWLWAIATLSAAQPSFAANKQAQGRAAKERAAKKACLAGDPAKGVEILAELYVDTDDITYIFNQGRCFEQNRRYEDAVGRFREYLVKGEARLSTEDQAVAQKRIETCESYLPKSEPRAASMPEPAPTTPTVSLPPTQTVTEPPVVAIVQPSPASDVRPGSGLRVAGIAVGAVGAAAVLTGVLLNLKVNNMSNDLERSDTFDRDTDTLRKDYKTLSLVSYGVGAACLAGGSVLYYLGWSSGRVEPTTVTLLPSLGPDAAGAMLSGAF